MAMDRNQAEWPRRLCVALGAPMALMLVLLLPAAASVQHGRPVESLQTDETSTTRGQPIDDEGQPDGAATTVESRPTTTDVQPGASAPPMSTPSDGAPSSVPATDAPTTAAPSTSPPSSIARTTEAPATEETPTTDAPATQPSADQTDREVPALDRGRTELSRPAQVQSSTIPISSILLAVLVLVVIGVVARVLNRRQPAAAIGAGDETAADRQVVARQDDDVAAQLPDVQTLALLLELGRVLISTGVAVSMVESTLRRVAVLHGIDDLGTIILPTSLVLSIPGGGEVQTEAGAVDPAPLRLDQMADLTNLVRCLTHTSISVDQAQAELRRIQRSNPPFSPSLRVAGYYLTTVGLVLILNGTWKELLVGGAVGAAVGLALVATRHITASWYVPFQPLVAALASSIAAFTAAHLIGDFRVVPALVAPLVTMLPGSKLTMGVIELVTGHLVAGTARVASGLMQLVLLALGIVAGAQLVGVPGEGLRTGEASSMLGMIAPWVGIAVMSVGVVWFNGVRRSSRWWMMAVLYVAYAGQVLGALFFGGALSAFFGAVAMTPVAVLASRQASGASPLVTFFPAFWMLVPGALGLQGVSMLLGPLGSNAASTLVTTLISMIGVSLGILVGLAFIGRDPDQAWFGDMRSADDSPAESWARSP
ncbi:MAG: threonine/serine exporter family protein [Candidatus Microthrix sp.]|nr:threonine/serine exporter family protein [Candidatus Microthrix sp.]